MSDSVVHALAGAGGGIISMVLTYPLITVSTRSQVDTSTFSSKSSQLDFARKILQNEGISGLYSGMKSALVAISITQAIYYYWYELVKDILVKKSRKKTLSVLHNMITGGIAGSITAVLTNPIWVINTRLLVKSDTEGEQVQEKKIGMMEAAKKVYQDDGILGFWRGVVPALALVSNPIIQYTVFERLKRIWEKTKGELSSYHFFLLGAVSKLCATGITYPYIVIKSRMHVSKSKSNTCGNGATQVATQPPPSVMSSFQQIIKEEGVAGLYKGISSKLAQSVLTSALMFGFKEELFRLAMSLLVLLKIRS